MTAVWATIAGLALATAAIKAAGPVALGGRELPRAAIGVIALLAPALLAALVLTETLPPPTAISRSTLAPPVSPPPPAPCCCGRRCS